MNCFSAAAAADGAANVLYNQYITAFAVICRMLECW